MKPLFIWILLTGPLHPGVPIGTDFGGAYMYEVDCRRAADEMTLRFNAPAGEYHCERIQVCISTDKIRCG
jgi:hypothetical protein